MGGRVEHRGVTELVYLYGFVPADAPAPPAALTGVADAAVERMPLGAVTAVVSRLPADEYGAATLEARLQDMGWVGAQGVAHERVVLWFVDHSEIVPARLFSLYGGVEALRSACAAGAADIAAQLDALAGRREWNLKVAYDVVQLTAHAAEASPEVRALDDEIEAAPPGRKYLLQRKRADVVKQQLRASARRVAADLLAQLRTHAEAASELPLAQQDEGGTVVLNAALLVRREQEPALRAQADELTATAAGIGVIATFSGPWAPYRFLEMQSRDA
jgi:hypothetical protein